MSAVSCVKLYCVFNSCHKLQSRSEAFKLTQIPIEEEQGSTKRQSNDEYFYINSTVSEVRVTVIFLLSSLTDETSCDQVSNNFIMAQTDNEEEELVSLELEESSSNYGDLSNTHSLSQVSVSKNVRIAEFLFNCMS